METATDGFLDRINLTTRLDENLIPFMDQYGFNFFPYGHPVILSGNNQVLHHIRDRKSKKSEVVLMVKFSPDFIVLPNFPRAEPFFVDTKASITPVYFQAQINRIREQAGLASLQREDILVVEREAWDTYTRYYPSQRVALVIASPYHPRLLLAEWVSNIKNLYRFEQDHNAAAGGSGTPHVNLHAPSLRTLEDFLADEFSIVVDSDDVEVMHDIIRSWPLNKTQGTVNWTQFNNVIVELQESCPWLQTRMEPEGWRPRPRRPQLL